MAKQFTVKILFESDISLLRNVAEGVFDNPVDVSFSHEFLNDPRHHIVVAISEDMIVGFASVFHYIHPDKPPELWINEVAVAPSHQKQGIAKAILKDLLKLGRELGCKNAWVLTDRNNAPANRLYQFTGGQIAPGDTVMYEFDITKE